MFDSRYFASSSSLLGVKYEEFASDSVPRFPSDSVPVFSVHFRKFSGGTTGASSSSLLKAKSCETSSPLRSPKMVACKPFTVRLDSVMFKFKHTIFSIFRYVGAEFISILQRNTSPTFSSILPRCSIFEKIISRLAKEYLLSCPPRTRTALNLAFSVDVNFSCVQSFHARRALFQEGNFEMLSRR